VISLEGMPGDLVEFAGATDLPLSNATYSALLASLPQGFLQQTNLPAGWTSLLQAATADLDGDGNPDALDLSNATVTAEVTGTRWRVNLKNGHKLFIVKNTQGDGNPANDVLNVRSESRSFDLEPQSFSLEVIGVMTMSIPAPARRTRR